MTTGHGTMKKLSLLATVCLVAPGSIGGAGTSGAFLVTKTVLK